MTSDFYHVVETSHGIDVYENGQFVCEIGGMCLDAFTYDGKVSEDKLGKAIREEIEVEDFLKEN